MGAFDGFAELLKFSKGNLDNAIDDTEYPYHTDESKLLFEQLEPRVMLAADLAALNALNTSTYLEDLDTYLESHVFNQELLLINNSFASESEVNDFVSNIDDTLASFSLTDGELSIQGFKDEVSTLFPAGNDNYAVQVAVSGNEYSDELLFQLDFSFNYSAKFDAEFDINEDNFKLITMISNLKDGSSVNDVVDVDINMSLSYAFGIEEVIPAEDPDKFYVDQADAGGPDSIAGQYTINDKNDNILYKQKLNSDNSLLTDINGNAIYTDKNGDGEYRVVSNSYLQNSSTNKYLTIDASATVSEVDTVGAATAFRQFDTLFSINSRKANSSGVGGAFSLDYKAILNDSFSAIGQVGGMTALIYEKDNTSFTGKVGSDGNLTVDGSPVSTTTQLLDLIKNHKPADKSDSELMFDFFADDDTSSESHADGRIVTSVSASTKYNRTYTSEAKSFSAEAGLTTTEFKGVASTDLYNEDVDIYLYAKMALVPELDEWTDLVLEEKWLEDSLSELTALPELSIETPIFLHAGKTAADIATIKGEAFTVSDTLKYEEAGAFQGFEVIFAPSILDVGMFWGNMIDSFVNQLGDLFDPIMPAVDMLLADIPGLSDLTERVGMGNTTTIDFLQGLASLYAIKDEGKAASALAITETALKTIKLLNEGKLPADSEPDESSGHLRIGVYDFEQKEADDDKKKPAKASLNDSNTKDSDALNAAKDKSKKSTNTKETSVGGSYEFDIDTPLFTSPEDFVLGIFAGDTSASLFNLDLLLQVGIEMEITIPFLSIGVVDLALIIKPSLTVEFNVGAGFDLYGMNKFTRNLKWNTEDGDTLTAFYGSVLDNAEGIYFDGFYFDDHYDATKKKDGKEFTISLGLDLGLSVGIPDLGPVTIRAGVLGGLVFEFGVDINDMPDKLPYTQWRDPVEGEGMLYKYAEDQSDWKYDYHVHLNELKEMHRAKNMFGLDISVSFRASFFVEIGIDAGFFSFTLVDWSMTLFEITLFEASISSPDSAYDIIVNKEYVPPVMSGWRDQNAGELDLYVGADKSKRQNTNKDGNGQDDITDEKYIINVLGYTQADGTYSDTNAGLGESIEIRFNGNIQEVGNVKKIYAKSGEGDDKIQVRSKGTHVTSIAVDFEGGEGDDILSYTGIGAARMLGDAGQDKLIGGSGNDTLSGGAGNDILYGRDGADIINGNDGHDQLEGGKGVDTLDGGSGGYVLVADKDDVDNDGDKEELINGKYKGDQYTWKYGDGNDIITDSGVASGENQDYDKISIAGQVQKAGRVALQQKDDVDVTADSGKVKIAFAEGSTVTLDGVEEVLLGVNGGGDIVDVFDYSTTDLELLALGLDYDSFSVGGAELNIQGSSGDDTIKAYTKREGSGANVVDVVKVDRGGKYVIGINKSDADTDYLNLYGYAGADTLEVISDDITKVSDYITLGVVDGGSGGDTIKLSKVTGSADNKIKIIGGDGNDKITVNSSSDFIIIGEDKESSPTVSTNDEIIVDAGLDFDLYAGGGSNTITVSNSSDFSVKTDDGDQTVTFENVSDFAADIKNGMHSVTFNKKVADGKIDIGTGKATVKTGTIDAGLAYNLLRMTIGLGGGSVTGDVIDLNSAQALVLNASDNEDKITISNADAVVVNAGDGADTVKLNSSKNSTLNLEEGNDAATITGSNTIVVNGGTGHDVIVAEQTTNHKIYGQDDIDYITSSFGEALLDGENITITDSSDGTGLSNTVEVDILDNTIVVRNSEHGAAVTMTLAGMTGGGALNLNSKNNSATIDNKVSIKGINTSWNIKGGAGTDYFVIDSITNNAININGGSAEVEDPENPPAELPSDNDKIIVNYQTGKNSGTITATSITGTGSAAITVSNLEKAEINLTKEGDEFIISDMFAETSVYGGWGDDTIIIDKAPKKLTLSGGTSSWAGSARDAIVFRLTDAVTLDANTFKDVKLTVPNFELRNGRTTASNFMIKDKKLYSAVTSGVELIDLASTLSSGTLNSVKITGNSKDTLTINDSELTASNAVEVEGNTIEYGNGGATYLNTLMTYKYSSTNSGYSEGLSDSFVEWNFAVPTRYYANQSKVNGKWEVFYSRNNGEGDDANGSIELLANGYKFNYTDKDGVSKVMALIDNDTDGYYDINTADEFYALLRTTSLGALGAKYELKADIDLTNYTNQCAIGSKVYYSNPISEGFTGEINGNGHSITGFSSSSDTEDAGLIYSVKDGATVKNIHFINCAASTTADGKSAGLITGTNTYKDIIIKNVTLTNCSVSALSAGASGGVAGGLIGTYKHLYSTSTIEDCYVKDSLIVGTARSGGLIGSMVMDEGSSMTIKHCKVEGLKYSGANVTSAGLIDYLKLYESYIGPSRDGESLLIDECNVINSGVKNGLFNEVYITGNGQVHCKDTIVEGEYTQGGVTFDKSENGVFNSVNIIYGNLYFTNCKFSLDGVDKGIATTAYIGNSCNLKFDKCTIDVSDNSSIVTSGINTVSTIVMYGELIFSNNAFIFNSAQSSTTSVLAESATVEANGTFTNSGNRVSKTMSKVVNNLTGAISSIGMTIASGLSSSSAQNSAYGYYVATPPSSSYGNTTVSDSGNPEVKGYLLPVTAAKTTGTYDYIYLLNSEGRDNIYCYEKSNINSSFIWYTVNATAVATHKVKVADDSLQYLISTPDSNNLIAVGNSSVFGYAVNRGTGGLTKQNGSDLNEKVTATLKYGANVYLGTEEGNFYRVNWNGTDSKWELSANLGNSNSGLYGAVSKFVMSNDNKFMYALHRDNSAIEVYSANTDGTFTLKSVIREGVNGVRGISGVTGVMEVNGVLVACGYNDSTLAIFEIGNDHKSFNQVQYLQNGAGVNGIENPLELRGDKYNIYVIGETDTGVNTAKIEFYRAFWDNDPNTILETKPKLWNIEYSGLETLAFNMGSGSDSITINNADVKNINILSNAGGDQVVVESTLEKNIFNIDTGAGDDTVVVVNSQSTNNYIVKTQAGNDTLSIGSIGGISNLDTGEGNDTVDIGTVLSQGYVLLFTQAGNDVISIGKIEAGLDASHKTQFGVDAGAGNDTIELKSIGDFAYAGLQGGLGDDTITVYGAGISLGAEVGAYGNTLLYAAAGYGSFGYDKLIYYGTATNTINYPDGKISKTGDETVLNYYTLDSVTLPTAELFASLAISLETDADLSGDISEGDSIKVDASGSEIPGNAAATYEFDFGNDGVYEFSSTTAVNTITWATLSSYGLVDNGSYIVNMKVSSGGKVSNTSSNLYIKNKKRKISVTGLDTIEEDSEYMLTLDKNDSSEKGDDTISSWVVNWGDGSIITYDAGSASVKYTYATPGNYDISVVAYDEDGKTETATKSLTVTEDARAHINILNDTGESVNEGASYTLKLKSDRPQSGSGIWKVKWGDGGSSILSSLNTFNESQLVHKYSDGSVGGDDYTITIELIDSEGSFSETHSVKVLNVAPAVTLAGDAAVNEGAEYALTINAPTDVGNDTVSKYKVDWGDGSSVQEYAITFAAQKYIATHIFADAPAVGVDYTVKVSIVDEDGTYTDAATKIVTVNNVAPVITFDQAGDSTTVAEGSIVRITGMAYSDLGTDSVAGWVIDWGDGSTDTYTPAEMATFTTGIEHYYGTDGIFNIKVSAWDEDFAEVDAKDSSNFVVTVTKVEDDNTSSTVTPVHVPEWSAPEVGLSDSVDSVAENTPYALTLSNYSYDLPSSISIDEVLVNWGDGSVETLNSSQFMDLKDNQEVILYHTYADGDTGNAAMNISVTFKDIEIAKGDVRSTSVIPVGDPATDSGVVLKDGEPYYEGRRMVTDFGVIFSPGMITKDVDGTPTKLYQEIIRENGVYKLKEYNVIETVTDYNNTGAAPTLTLSVTDVAPAFTIKGKGSVMQGSEYILNVSDVLDVQGDELTQYVVDWGDGSSTVINTAAIAGGESVGDGRTLAHTYTAEGAKSITITSAVSDGTTHSDSLSNTLTLTVEDAPMSIELSGSDKVYELSDYTLALGKITDPADLTRNVVPEKWIVNWGDGKKDEIINSGSLTTKELMHSYSGTMNFVYNVGVDFVVDGNTYSASTVQNVTVTNAPPVVSLDSANTSIDEGGKFTGNYSFVDNGMDTSWTVKVDYGDGSAAAEIALTEKDFVLEHDYVDNGSYAIKFTVTDERGAASDEFTTDVTVSNVVPQAVLSGDATIAEGSEYSLTIGGITDPGTDTVSSYIIDWGDSNATTVSPAELASAGNILKHIFADNSTPVIKLTLIDEDGTHVAVATKSITVTNVIPQATLTGDITVEEGSEYSLTVSGITDPGADTVSKYVIDWGDGNTEEVLSADLASSGNLLKHTFADNSTPEIKLTLVDEDGTHSDVVTKSITVTNVDPQVTIAGGTAVAEGSEYSLTVSGITDPGADTVSKYLVDWGDGNVEEVLSSDLVNAGNVLKHIFADNSIPEIKLTLVDEDGTYTDVATKSITVNNVAPQATLTGNATVEEGSEYSLIISSITDPGADTVSKYLVDWGDGDIQEVLSTDLASTGNLLKHTFADNSTPVIKLSLVDEDGTYTDVTTKSISVGNVDPQATLSGDATVEEGREYSLTIGDVVDPGADTVSKYKIDWGDGNTEEVLAADLASAGNILNHTFADNSTPIIKLSLVDEDGTYTDVTTKNLTVTNVVPMAVLSGDATVEEGSEYALTIGDIVDPGADTVSKYKIDWGDGNTDEVLSVDLTGVGSILKHTYADNSTPVIKLTLIDEDGTHVDVETKSITVTNVVPRATLTGIDTLNEGDEYSLTIGDIIDPGADTLSSYIIDWGDGQVSTILAGDLPVDRIVKHTFIDDSSSDIKLTLVDEDGTHTAVAAKSLTVNNIDPDTTISGDTAVDEGVEYSLRIGDIIDPGDDTVASYTIDWGDGEVSIVGASELSADGVVKHTYSDNIVPEIKLSLTDEDGVFTDVAVLAIEVMNVAPDLNVSDSVGMIMQSVAFSNIVTLVDNSSADEVDVIIDFGNGEAETIEAGKLREVILNKAYTVPGNYIVSLYAKDDDGGISGKYSFAVQVISIPSTQETGSPSGEDEEEYIELPVDLTAFNGLLQRSNTEEGEGSGEEPLLLLENEGIVPSGSSNSSGAGGNTFSLFTGALASVQDIFNSVVVSRLIDISDIVSADPLEALPEFIDVPQADVPEVSEEGEASGVAAFEVGGHSEVSSMLSFLSTDEVNSANMMSSELLLSIIQEFVSAQQALINRHENSGQEV